jgi:hypothetical protein
MTKYLKKTRFPHTHIKNSKNSNGKSFQNPLCLFNENGCFCTKMVFPENFKEKYLENVGIV